MPVICWQKVVFVANWSMSCCPAGSVVCCAGGGISCAGMLETILLLDLADGPWICCRGCGDC